MILIFGGTTEGKNTIQLLDQLGLPYLYSTKTNIDVELGSTGRYRFGALDANGLLQLVRAENIELVIDAAHPFAEQLHQMVAGICEQVGIPAIRYERIFTQPVQHPLVQYVADYKEAVTKLLELGTTRLLALTGVQTIERLQVFWQQQTAFFRILDRESSKSIAQKAGFPDQQLILSYPSKEVKDEIDLIKAKNIDGILTKESGESGFLSIKIEAALATQTPIVIIEKPKTPEVFQIVNCMDGLKEQINTLYTKFSCNDLDKRGD